ncbi:hydantoinase/oxoprolinase family protein [Elizabethkingia anophelis]|uniref:hydantoinase/oxoprolinase family protein n=1 Tax=Elizabethkingia anophelis TaxID=1117645 RepID=UPI0016296272|nr:hydantoinase/oxoprolinase family protein [Elizabethkingia anophelis]MCT4214555.1 hydantoinase/oxoprolinase family protein [Elizabethkingia anophelis]MCT4323378.1 hydantoinase/oxoprolinase family protein [Elizabethkingia anophelis]HAY3535756.1 hydantoinase/oxoprolinase family protein [Elizabethkingia anophelis]HAY3547973.1 hydantoinase/oxoprolinase family protein [Elizabethkingia anophelis]HAY3592782.1 hydantoinase/oxoprolinase family protein [Elizabethkingia anophelis]
MRVATDIGGTFTDLVSFEYDPHNREVTSVKVSKASTTPGEFEKGIINAINNIGLNLESTEFFAHGTTVVINAITERKGSKTALITTKGFRDVLEIARGTRPDLYNFNFKKEDPFVERHLRQEVDERINYLGEIVTPLDITQVDKIIEGFIIENVESIAVCLLHGYKNPVHEKLIADYIRNNYNQFEVISSHEVTREWREYERTSSVVLSGYVKPIATKYLNNLTVNLKQMGYKNNLYIMQSNGGITTVEDVKANPITLIESGPASGMLGAVVLGNTINKKNLIVLDIGGTTAKCSLIENGSLKIVTTYNIEKTKTEAGFPILTPVIDIVEIGNGGGSIAWLDEGGKMRVGPKSAGANPGPSSYGKDGTNFTTTDANVVCNRIHKDYFLGGLQKPDMDSLKKAAQPLCDQLNMSMEEIARGVIRIANSNMVNALKSVSVNKGYDPRDFSLVVIGGGGPMHGAYLAEELQIPEVIVPLNAGVFSAFGMLMSDLRRDYIRTDVSILSHENRGNIKETFKEMEQVGIDAYKRDGYPLQDILFEYYLDLRYEGQEHSVKLKLNQIENINIEETEIDFHKLHEKRFAFQLPDTGIEIVNFHLVAEVEVNKPLIAKVPVTGMMLKEAILTEDIVDYDELGIHMSIFYNREKLEPGMGIQGPAIIVEKASSTVVPPQHQLRVDEYANLIINKNI